MAVVECLPFCPLDDESMDSDDTLLVADVIDAFGGVTSRFSELLRELQIGRESGSGLFSMVMPMMDSGRVVPVLAILYATNFTVEL